MKISLVVPNRNNLKYFKWSYDSIRKNQGNHEVFICSAVDACTDGTLEYYKELAEKDDHFKFIINEGPERVGHTILYDRIIDELVDTDVFMIWHCDMYLCPKTIDSIEKNINRDTIVSLTRIEPPLHPPGPEKIVQDFGQEPEEFTPMEDKFLNWYENTKFDRKGKTTEGIFAPWAIYKSKFQEIGGHDRLYRPQSKEDCITGDRYVVYIENNKIKIETIEYLFETYSNHIITREDGKQLIDFIKNDIHVYSATATLKGVGKGRIKKIIRNKNKKQLFKIRTNWGETVCTSDHSLLNKSLDKVKPKNLITDDVWEPFKIGDWTRRTVTDKIDICETFECSPNSNIVSIINDIDCYGNNKDLIDICEYLGFFVAEGSTCGNVVNIHNCNLTLLENIKEKSLKLFNVKYHELVTDDNSYKSEKPVYRYSFVDSTIAEFLRELCGKGSENKKVPTFIYNIPKCYQEAFLYGYLNGDGYLGTSICRQHDQESFSVDKRLLFSKNIFPELNWKSTSKSAHLTCGINYLLRKNTGIKTNINFQSEKGLGGVYNISTCKEYKYDILEITPYKYNGYVYDLEINKTHTFIDAMGLFGLHNSDIFNRFELNDLSFIQTWEGCVYHMTCRGSRYNPTITTVGKESDEWLKQNNKSARNFIRKWGHFVKHDQLMKPIVPNRYNVGFVVVNCDEYNLTLLEPWCDTIYSDVDYTRYISLEQKNTDFDLSKKLKRLEDKKENDIIITFDATKLHQGNFEFFNILQLMIQDTNTTGAFEYDIFNVEINNLQDHSKNLINISDTWYQDKLL